jgi:hypothetical protein
LIIINIEALAGIALLALLAWRRYAAERHGTSYAAPEHALKAIYTH